MTSLTSSWRQHITFILTSVNISEFELTWCSRMSTIFAFEMICINLCLNKLKIFLNEIYFCNAKLRLWLPIRSESEFFKILLVMVRREILSFSEFWCGKVPDIQTVLSPTPDRSNIKKPSTLLLRTRTIFSTLTKPILSPGPRWSGFAKMNLVLVGVVPGPVGSWIQFFAPGPWISDRVDGPSLK